MRKVVGVRFKPAGKIYDFLCGAFVLEPGDAVIVESEQGLGFAIVANAPIPEAERASKGPLKKVFRMATKADFAQREANARLEDEAHAYCLDCIERLGLQMNLFAVESAFDAAKLTFFFTAEGRVDFRQLVKDLVKRFRIRIEMRQVGIRNQAKMLGGIGRCGREVCCTSFLENFEPVSIRMAKEQGLSLNPTKISGLCGRLMCCLTYENSTYVELKKKLPKCGRFVETEKGRAKVLRQNVLAERVVVRFEDGSEAEIAAGTITGRRPGTGGT
ncbi:MAG: stage 0 sporulation protein [Deltaproteobacteria bacterium]|nr:MAG: stage 0 sporulation protein [Deltaproteobacteria bacterium]